MAKLHTPPVTATFYLRCPPAPASSYTVPLVISAGNFWHVMCFFLNNCGDQVGKAAESPDLPSGSNAQGLVVCGNGASRYEVYKVILVILCQLNLQC